MPNRELREGLLSSENMACLTAEEERLFVRLISCADDYGRFDGRPMIVKSRAFPLADMMSGVTLQAVETWLQALHHRRMVRLYEVQGKPFLVIDRWNQRVRASASKYPAPPGECPTDDGQMTGECPTDDGHPLSSASEERGARNEERITRSEERGNTARQRARTLPPKSPIPSDFAISDAVMAWGKGKGIDPRPHLEPFIAKCKAKGYTYLDWDSAFMEAIRTDWAGLSGKPNGRAPPSRIDKLDRQAATIAQLTGRSAPQPHQDTFDVDATVRPQAA